MNRFVKWIIMLALALVLVSVSSIAAAGILSQGVYQGFTWTVSDKGVVDISGSGDLPARLSCYGNKSFVKEVNIGEGITSIGKYDFANCYNLKRVSLPSSLQKISDNAFQDCRSLKCVILPDGFDNIGESAFSGCENLKGINMPDSVTQIGVYAFRGCVSIQEMYIPAGVTNVYPHAFFCCSGLQRFIVSDNNSSYAVWDGVLCSKDLSTVVCCPAGKESILFPEGVLQIGNSAFLNCNCLTSVTIPGSVTSIGESAFNTCQSLENVIIPDSVISIGGYAFLNCSSLENVVLPSGISCIGKSVFSGCSSLINISIPNGVTTIGENAFSGCMMLSELLIPEEVVSIGRNAFSSSGLASIHMPASLKTIGDGAFSSCYSLTAVVIPENVSYISARAFSSCYDLKKVLFQNAADSGVQIVIDSNAFDSLQMVYCYRNSSAADWCFSNCYQVSYLDEIGMESIRTLSPQECSIRMPCGETFKLAINAFPFAWGPLVWTSSNPAVVSVDDGMITALSVGTAEITVSMGDQIIDIPVETFVEISDFDLPDTELWVITQDRFVLRPSSVQPEGIDPNIYWYSSDDECAGVGSSSGLVITHKPGDVIITAGSYSDIEVTTNISSDSPSGHLVKRRRIEKECLVHVCYPVSAINLSAPQLFVGVGADLNITADVTMNTQYCENHLVTFSSSDNTIAAVDEAGTVHGVSHGDVTITAIAASGISDSIGLHIHDISVIPAVEATQTQTGLTEGIYCSTCGEILVPQETIPIDPEAPFIGRGSFNYGLTWELDAQGVLTISGSGEMDGHPWPAGSVKRVVIQDGVTYIGEQAFYNCSNLTDITLPDSVTGIGMDAFYSCSSLTSITLPDNLTGIGSGAFSCCTNLENINIPAKVDYIGSYAFQHCYSLTSITIPDRNSFLGVGAFYSCRGLKSVKLPVNLTKIESTLFLGCSSLNSVIIPDSVTDIAYRAFWGCTSLSNVIIPSNVQSIGAEVFYGCSSLAHIVIPAGIKWLYYYTFADCSSLESICVLGKSTSFVDEVINTSPNVYCFSDSNAYIWATSQGLGIVTLDTFMDGQGTVFELPSDVLSIGEEAFAGIKATKISLPSGLESIGAGAFANIKAAVLKIRIPSGVKSIADTAFSGCCNVIIYGKENSVAETYANAHSNCTFVVDTN